MVDAYSLRGAPSAIDAAALGCIEKHEIDFALPSGIESPLM